MIIPEPQQESESSDSECTDTDCESDRPTLSTFHDDNTDVDHEDGAAADHTAEPLHVAVSSGDFGQVAILKTERKLTDHEKFALLSRHFVPHRTYKFPTRNVGGRDRAFQQSWLDKYNGLVYSESQNGGYCMYCVLFAREGGRITLGALVNSPLIDFKRATEKLAIHFSKKFHIESLQTAESFTAMMRKPDLSIDRRLSSERSKRAAENSKKLMSIAETVILCGRQGFALRGHRDDSLATNQDPDANHGNFLALLKFRVQAGDMVLKDQS